MVEEDKQESIKQVPVPDHLQDEKVSSTTIRKLSSIIEEKLLQLQDLATLELRMPVEARMRDRMKSIQKVSAARHLNIDGHWKTTPPHMHVTKFSARKISNDEAQIKFSVYEVNKQGDKRLYENKVEETRSDGVKTSRTLSAEYRIAYEVTETILRNKPITREIVEIDNNR